MQNNDDYGEVEIYTLTDEDDQETEFELIGKIELDGQEYVALFPMAEEDEDTDEYEYVVLKVIQEDGEDAFVTIDDDDEFERVADEFEKQLIFDTDYDDDDEEDDDSDDDDDDEE